MKLKNKTIASLLTIALLIASLQILSTAIVHADVTHLTMLTHWTAPDEVGYWGGVIAAYEAAHPDVDIEMINVAFDVLLQEITLRHQANTDTDIIHFYDMWLPGFANWISKVVAIPPADVQADVKANWQPASVAMSTYNGIVYGYPTEYANWALVYNRVLIQNAIDAGNTALIPILADLEAGVPLSWTDFETAARALAKWDTSVSPPKIVQTGFLPMVVAAQGRFQFLSLLWSNGGEYYDLSVPQVLFDTQNAYDTMQLLSDLGYEEPRSFDPSNIPDYWWGAWTEETIAMMMLPVWMNYIRWAMGENFWTHLGVAPNPVGPLGTQSVSNTYGWMLGVSEKAATDVEAGETGKRARLSWDFLRWLNQPRAAGSIPMPPAYGDIPKGEQQTIMGDWFLFDFIIPSRTSDQAFVSGNYWLEGFMNVANTYGRASVDNIKSAQIDAEINLMFDRVILTGADPATEVHDAALRVQGDLPMSGDVNIDGTVNIQDVPLIIADIDATPAVPQWNRGRSEFARTGNVYVINVQDITVLSTNYGKSGDP